MRVNELLVIITLIDSTLSKGGGGHLVNLQNFFSKRRRRCTTNWTHAMGSLADRGCVGTGELRPSTVERLGSINAPWQKRRARGAGGDRDAGAERAGPDRLGQLHRPPRRDHLPGGTAVARHRTTPERLPRRTKSGRG